jgi:hypothetical protein
MRPDYELRPVTIARSPGQRPAALVAVLVLVGVLVVLKPWDFVDIDAGSAPPVQQAQAPNGAVAPAQAIAPPGAVAPKPSGLGSLAQHSGTWGVGASGIGPHNEAEPWAEWAAVAPEAVGSTVRTPQSPSSGRCGGVPSLPAEPLFIAVSHESDVPIDRRVLGWWWDAGTPRVLDGTIHQVTTADRGIAYVIRNDHSPWPAGLYEFELIAGADAVALTVCLVSAP